MAVCSNIGYVLDRLAWMRAGGIWPNGLRYLWTDAFGVVLLDEFEKAAPAVLAELHGAGFAEACAIGRMQAGAPVLQVT